ncbi:ACT domain-containing protein [Alterinioella nitratireducens]|uniref:ACT domain-containing protein n=1 Tax=Alterinioella nitratireducens TaxID=2735915 RepID=UPI0015574ABD|nr:ACT domain-containing protein [Alterinioella nitratireducens]NPD19276.1 ACT domain-containing protein [Alterinioella nitratireducens]
MSGETDLGKLLAGLRATLVPGTYVFATLTGPIPRGVTARMVFREAEGTTLILTRAEAEAAGLAYEFPSRMITLDVHSALEAVGFIAVIATELAKAGMGVNPVAGFYHDHIFVPEGREGDALRILTRIAADHAG